MSEVVYIPFISEEEWDIFQSELYGNNDVNAYPYHKYKEACSEMVIELHRKEMLAHVLDIRFADFSEWLDTNKDGYTKDTANVLAIYAAMLGAKA